MKNKKILLIGGPGTGKSSVIQSLEKKGYSCLHEISREVTLAAQKKGIDQLFLTEPLLFSKLLLEGRVKQFQDAENRAAEWVFFDRGIPDVSAYMDYSQDEYPNYFRAANEKHRYDFVFFFPLWEGIYKSDNERYESYKQAKRIEKYLWDTYSDLGYSLIEIPKITVEERANFIIEKLTSKAL